MNDDESLMVGVAGSDVLPTVNELKAAADKCAKSLFQYVATLDDHGTCEIVDTVSNERGNFKLIHELGVGSYGSVFSLAGNGFDNYVIKIFSDPENEEQLTSHVAEAAAGIIFGGTRKVSVPVHPKVPMLTLKYGQSTLTAMISERYDMDLFKLIFSFDEYPLRRAELYRNHGMITYTVGRMYGMMVHSGFICLDRRPPNILVRMNGDKMKDIRLSDMDLGMCCTIYGSIARNAFGKYYIKALDRKKPEIHHVPWATFTTKPGTIQVPDNIQGVQCKLNDTHVDMIIELQIAFTLIPLGIYSKRKMGYILRYFEDIFNNPLNSDDEKIKRIMDNDFMRMMMLFPEDANDPPRFN